MQGYLRVQDGSEDGQQEHVAHWFDTGRGAEKAGTERDCPTLARCSPARSLMVLLLLILSIVAGLPLARFSSDYAFPLSTNALPPTLPAQPSAAALCAVEESEGYWTDDDEHNMSWYVSLPGECRIFPFLHHLLQLPQPPQMALWPKQISASDSPQADNVARHQWSPPHERAAQGGAVDHSSFLHNRFILWITDSIDRHPLGELCSRLGPGPAVFAIHKYPVHVSEHYGLTLCHQPNINITFAHAQTFGLQPDDPQAALKGLIDEHIPQTLGQALLAHNISRASHLQREVQSALPDMLVVHTCRWDENQPAVAPSSPQNVAFAWYMKRFETLMLIPVLHAYSQHYRAWQHSFILKQIQKQSDNDTARTLSSAERSEMYERLRADLFSLHSEPADYNTMLTLAPNPHSHPIDTVRDESRCGALTGCPDEPFVVVRNCAPPRADLTNFHEREATRKIINAAIRAVSRQYGLRLLDMDRMLEGVQARPNFMWDFIHWNARPWLQTLNVLINMLSQHVAAYPHTAADERERS